MNTRLKLYYLLWKIWIELAFTLSKRFGSQQAFRLFTTPVRKDAWTKPEEFQSAETINLFVSNKKLVGYVWNRQAQHKILILHGFESRAYKFHMYIAPLLEKGYGIVAMDAAAHGDSQGTTILIYEYAKMIEELEQRFGVFYGCIAHSFAGIALCWHREQHVHPENKIVLIAPGTETSTAIDLFCSRLGLGEIEKKALINYIEQRGGHSIEYYSITRIVRKISNKIFWIHDEDDKITPLADAQPIISSPPNYVEMLITKGLGHNKIYRDKHTVGAVISFLDR